MLVERFEPSSLNYALAASVISKLKAKAAIESAKAALWRSAGYSMVILALGAGTGAALYGGSFLPGLKTVAPPPIIIHDQAANDAPRSATTQSQSLRLFGLGGGTGTALDGGWSLTDATAGHQQTLAGHDQTADEAHRPPPAQVQSDSPPASKAKVVTNYTTFHTVPFGIGEVQTAWNYDNSNQTNPTTQYCLYVVHPANQPSSYVSIGSEGHMDLPSHGIAGVDLKAAYANCVWTATETRADIEAAGIDQKTPVEKLKTKTGRKKSGKEGIYLGIFADALGSIILRYRGQKHILSFGVPGANKSSGYAVCNIQNLMRSIIAIDVKGQLAAITARARAKMGKVIILNPFGEFVEELPHLESIGWNPIAHIDPDSDTFESDAFCVAEAIIDKSEGGGNNKFFENNALYLLAGLIMWECYQFRGKARLSNVIALLSIREERDGKGQVIGGLLPTLRLMSNCENLAISTLGARLYGRLTDTNSKATSAEDVIDTAIGSARFLNDPNIRADMFKGGAIDFRALHYELTTIYLILPVGQLIDQAKWLRLFVNVALREFYKKKPKKPKLDPVLFLIDEFGNIGHLSQIESALTLSRDYRVQLWIFLQNLGQIKASYKDKWEPSLSA